ncbi:MAG: OmpH family outer membrane protein [Syntrophaceae bacterium]|nr:OmpH family outer membrane protein [Syntrophaceae bacterium]
MKKNIYLMTMVTLFVFVWSVSSLAVDKIGFINLRDIIQGSNAGKKATDDFTKFMEKEKQEIQALEKELKKMKDDLEKQGSIMTAKTRSEKEAAYQKKMRDYQLQVNDSNEELQRRDQEMMQKLIPEILKIVRSIAEKEKYTLVIDVATMTPPYYAKENDFSKRVIEEFNKSK